MQSVLEAPLNRFCYGMIYGDFVKDEEVDGCIMVGQIASGFVPFVADGRDVVANFQKGDWLMALFSSSGFVPIAGDSVKVIGDLGQAVKRLGDDAVTLVKLLVKTSDDYPWLAKFFYKSELVTEGVENAVHAPAITRKNLDKILKVADDAEVVLEPTDDILEQAFKNPIKIGEDVWSMGACKRGQIIDRFINKHDGVNGLGENFPVFDRLVDETLISTKSLDTTAKTYRDPKKLKSRIQSYIDKMNAFETKYPKVNTAEGFQWGGYTCTA